jgi:hypothetical protein
METTTKFKHKEDSIDIKNKNGSLIHLQVSKYTPQNPNWVLPAQSAKQNSMGKYIFIHQTDQTCPKRTFEIHFQKVCDGALRI